MNNSSGRAIRAFIPTSPVQPAIKEETPLRSAVSEEVAPSSGTDYE